MITSFLLFILLLILAGPFVVVGAIAVLVQATAGPVRRPSRPQPSFRARGLVMA